jgi:hypothetical protein
MVSIHLQTPKLSQSCIMSVNIKNNQVAQILVKLKKVCKMNLSQKMCLSSRGMGWNGMDQMGGWVDA